MAKKDIVALVAVAVVIIIIFVIVFLWGHGVTNPTSVDSVNSNGTATTSTVASATRAALPADITVPDQGSTNTQASVAVPILQAVANATGSASYRSFSITAENDTFTPNTVIVNMGDSVDLMITAVGESYDFTQPDYGFHTQIPDGKTVKIDFQATATGQFTFYCASCGGPSKGPIGYIDVKPKQ